MKVLLLSHTDSGGGAAVATVRLLDALRKQGVDATLGVLEKSSDDRAIVCLKRPDKFLLFVLRVANKLRATFKYFCFRTTNPILHSENRITLLDLTKINDSGYDLIHLHWINYNTISIEDIARIKKPIIWTMHDTWLFCGAEHYPNVLEQDRRSATGYTKHNKPTTTAGIDLCRLVWQRKKKAWKDCSFKVISPSNYEKRLFDQSVLFQNSASQCSVIPYIVPDTIFRPLDRALLRGLYNIPAGKKVLGFGAAYKIDSKKSIKGGHLLLEALKKIKNAEDYYLVVFGQVDNSFYKEISLSVFLAGNITNAYILAGIYNLCDVFICPSLIDNLPNTCLEALFCGVPIAAFNVGGIPDIVEHKKNGYLAKAYDPADLCQGIMYCLDNQQKMAQASITKAHQDFCKEDIVHKHIELYKNVLNKTL
jgi:glycosyltransferase involved in cell wall biosynthesis